MSDGSTPAGRVHPAAPVILHGRRLLLARAAVAVVAVLVVGLFIRAVPLLYRDAQVVCTAPDCPGHLTPTPDLVPQMQALGLSRGAFAAYVVALDVVFAAVNWAVAAVLVWRRSRERMALLSALTLLTLGGATFIGLPSVLVGAHPSWELVVAQCLAVLGTCIVVLFYLFPDGRLVPRWSPLLAAPWILVQGGRYFFPDSPFSYLKWPIALYWLLFFGGITPALAAQIYRYRRVSGPLQRQQTKVVVFGTTLAGGGYLGVFLSQVVLMPFLQRNVLANLALATAMYAVLLLLPLSIGLAILRYRLWDVDELINRTLVYGALTAALAGVYLGDVVLFQGLLRALTGQRSDLAVVAATLLVAVLFHPLRQRLQAGIDRRFYRRKYDAARTLAAFSATVRDEVDLDRLTAHAVAVVEETLQPAHVSLWLPRGSGDGFPPGASPAFEIAPHDPLLAHVQAAAGPVDLATVHLSSPALEAMRVAGVTLVVPLVSQDKLLGLLRLGPRRSGQGYSTDDRTLLATLATQATPAARAAHLVRQQHAEIQARERVEQELRIAQQIQHTLLPKALPALPGWHLAAHYQPAREVGGDFYDVLALPDGRVGLIIGDVSDKGVPAALVMATTRSVLRGTAQQVATPGLVLARANELLYPDIPPAMFVTCLYALLDPASGQLRYANAGHDLPYLRHAGGVRELHARGMPLGLLPGMCYEEQTATIAPAETVLLYSDGLVETHNAQREMFGFPRLRDLVATHAAHDDTALIEALLADLRQFTGATWEQEDDITLVALQRCVAPASITA